MTDTDRVNNGLGPWAEAPVDERAPAGLVTGAVAEAVDDIQARRALRDQGGRFIKGSLGRFADGVRSQALLNALTPVKAAIAARVHDDLGADADGLPTTVNRIVDAFAEVSLLRSAVFEQMLGRPTTAKGYTRRLLTGYLALVDRELRLAETIGFGRQPPPVSALTMSASEVRALRDAPKQPAFDPDEPTLRPPPEFVDATQPKS